MFRILCDYFGSPIGATSHVVILVNQAEPSQAIFSEMVEYLGSPTRIERSLGEARRRVDHAIAAAGDARRLLRVNPTETPFFEAPIQQ